MAILEYTKEQRIAPATAGRGDCFAPMFVDRRLAAASARRSSQTLPQRVAVLRTIWEYRKLE